jgi:hypothetical protein
MVQELSHKSKVNIINLNLCSYFWFSEKRVCYSCYKHVRIQNRTVPHWLLQALHPPQKFEHPPFWDWSYGIKMYGFKVTFKGMTSLPNYIKIYYSKTWLIWNSIIGNFIFQILVWTLCPNKQNSYKFIWLFCKPWYIIIWKRNLSYSDNFHIVLPK